MPTERSASVRPRLFNGGRQCQSFINPISIIFAWDFQPSTGLLPDGAHWRWRSKRAKHIYDMTRPADHQRLQDALLSPSPGTLADQAYQWNTKHLPWRMSSDIVAASCASGIVSPFVYMIDRSAPSVHKMDLCKMSDSSALQIHHRARLLSMQPSCLLGEIVQQPCHSPSPLPHLETLPSCLGSLLWNILHSECNRHCNIYHHQEILRRHHLWACQILGNSKCQHVSMPLQGQSVYSNVRLARGWYL